LKERRTQRAQARASLLKTIGYKLPQPKKSLIGDSEDSQVVQLENMDDLQKKLIRKGVLPSLSLGFKRGGVNFVKNSQKQRVVKKQL
jgi:hypothetical protein